MGKRVKWELMEFHGKWCYLYRAIDRDGNLVDCMLSQKRDMEAAKRFFKQAAQTVGHTPDQVTASTTSDCHRIDLAAPLTYLSLFLSMRCLLAFCTEEILANRLMIFSRLHGIVEKDRT